MNIVNCTVAFLQQAGNANVNHALKFGFPLAFQKYRGNTTIPENRMLRFRTTVPALGILRNLRSNPLRCPQTNCVGRVAKINSKDQGAETDVHYDAHRHRITQDRHKKHDFWIIKYPRSHSQLISRFSSWLVLQMICSIPPNPPGF